MSGDAAVARRWPPDRSARLKLWVAFGLLATLSLVGIGVVAELIGGHHYYSLPPAPSLGQSFRDDAAAASRWASSTSAAAVASKGTSAKASSFAARPVVPTSVQAPAVAVVVPVAEVATVTPSVWREPEIRIAFAAAILGFAVAMGLVLSVALSGGVRFEGTLAADHGGVAREVRRLAEQVRRDADDLAHSLRTPIAIIRTYTEALKHAALPDDARVRRALEAVEVSSARLVSLTDDAWQKGDRLAQLFLATREPVEFTGALRETANEFAANGPFACHVEVHGDAPLQEPVVLAPAGVVEELLDCILYSFVDEAAPATALTARVVMAGDGVSVCMARQGTAPSTAAFDAAAAHDCVALVDAARTASLLQGELTAILEGAVVHAVTLTLPARGV